MSPEPSIEPSIEPPVVVEPSAASISEPPPRPDNFKPFIQVYQNTWGLIPPPFMADEIAEWCEKVPLAAWEYALKETMINGKRQNWKYAKAILGRVMVEGFTQPPNGNDNQPTVVSFHVEDIA